MKQKFIDAQEMAKKHPNTFEAPDEMDLNALKAGDTVKVCNGEERFWTTVSSIKGNKITAVVDNQTFTPGLDLGDEITFEKRHIYSIW